MAIQVLSQGVIQKIAAGEVIERPASVVRELIENALDAGARHIRVTIAGGGLQEIVVSDDGCGIAAGEIDLAFSRHATSKLAALEDLERLRTLGFRGEALFSIAAVADVTLTTARPGAAAGTRARFAFGAKLEQQPVAAAPGTTIAVRDLFADLPARRKFLRKPSTEGQQVVALVSRYAIAHSGVAFVAEVDGREVLRTLGGELLDAIRRVYGPEVGDALLPFTLDEDGTRVHGYAGPAHLHRSSSRHIDVFVNGRAIQDRLLSRAVNDAYRGLLPSGRFPVVCMLLSVPPDRLDVNVHPAKSEVRFAEPDRLFQAAYRALRQVAGDSRQVPPLADEPAPASGATWEARQALMHFTGSGAAPGRWSAPEPQSEGTPPLLATLPPLRPVGQIRQTYIVAEGPDGLYLVDQHAAHERVLFDRFMRQRSTGAVPSQALLAPLTLQLGAQRGAALPRLAPRLEELGIRLEPFGPDVALVRAVPGALAERGGSLEAAILDVFDAVAAGDEERWLEHSLVRLVCHSAVRAGEVLDIAQMREIMRELELTRSPRTCPHGRPTMLVLSAGQLEREFRRR